MFVGWRRGRVAEVVSVVAFGKDWLLVFEGLLGEIAEVDRLVDWLGRLLDQLGDVYFGAFAWLDSDLLAFDLARQVG